jgi:phospholipid transport system substrate-binding protein
MIVSMWSLVRRVALLLCLAALPNSAALGAEDGPAGFVADLGGRAIGVLTSSLAEAERERQFRMLFHEGFDVPAISRFVLGPYWRTASEEQRQEFVTLFEAYMVHAYSVRLTAYSGQRLQVLGSRPEGEGGALVESHISHPTGGGAPVAVAWRVNRTATGYSITDLMVQGVSMAVTERQEFASVIQRGGGRIEALLKLLRDMRTAT